MPEVSRNDSCTAFSLASQVDIQKPFFHEEFVPKWSLRSAIERTGNSEEELGPRFWETPIPCKILVKQAFFLQKEAEVQWEAACSRQTKLQEKFASFKNRKSVLIVKLANVPKHKLLQNNCCSRTRLMEQKSEIRPLPDAIKSIGSANRSRSQSEFGLKRMGCPRQGPYASVKHILYIYMFYTCLQTCAYESINTSYSNSRFRGPEIVRTCGQSSS